VVVRDNWGFLLVMAAGSIVGAANPHHCITAQLALKQSHSIEPEKLQLRGGAFAREPVGEPHLPQIALVAQDRPAMAGLSQLPTNQLV
jgi:hypothetical protein